MPYREEKNVWRESSQVNNNMNIYVLPLNTMMMLEYLRIQGAQIGLIVFKYALIT